MTFFVTVICKKLSVGETEPKRKCLAYSIATVTLQHEQMLNVNSMMHFLLESASNAQESKGCQSEFVTL